MPDRLLGVRDPLLPHVELTLEQGRVVDRQRQVLLEVDAEPVELVCAFCRSRVASTTLTMRFVVVNARSNQSATNRSSSSA